MEIGDRVEFLGASIDQIRWGGNDDPNEVLTVGNNYEISYVEVHSWHTKISLVGYDGLLFNNVSFKVVGEQNG